MPALDPARHGGSTSTRLGVDSRVGPEGGTAESSLLQLALASGYRLRARMTLEHPPSGTSDCSAELLSDVRELSGGRLQGYAVRLRELTGVPYVGLLRHGADGSSILAETLHGITLGGVHEVELVVEGVHLTVHVDGEVVLRGQDLHRLRGDRVGLRAHQTRATAVLVDFENMSDEPLPSPPSRHGATAPASATRGKPILVQGEACRIEVIPLSWPTGAELAVEVSVRSTRHTWTAPVHAGDWWLASGPHLQRIDLQSTANLARVSFASVGRPGAGRAVLHGRAEGYEAVSLEVSCNGPLPLLELTATPLSAGAHVALFQAFEGLTLDEVAEVVCGPLQHGRMVRGPELLGASELTTPFALVERTGEPMTWGVAIPATDLTFEDEQIRDPDDQPFGMSLRGEQDKVQPVVCLPQPGRRAEHGPDRPLHARVLLVMDEGELIQTYRSLVRREYGYRAYRRAIFDQSMTDTMFNLIDLVAMDAAGDDADNYQASPSGWWSRAKNWIDIENRQAVRSTTAGVLLSAAYITDDLDLYDRRARPVVEFHLSRNGYGWTPEPGRRVYGDETRSKLCSTPVGVTALGPLHELMRRSSPGIRAMARQEPGVSKDYWLQRSPISIPLARYRLNHDPRDLRTACALADNYIAAHLDTPPTKLVDPHDFAIFYVADWIGLLELHLETGEQRYLAAAHREALRFVTQLFVRPVPCGSGRSPNRPQIHDRQIDLGRWWNPEDLYQYPREQVPVEATERWLMSLTGMTFEAVQTYRYSGATMNPGWAAALLRLSALTGDDLLRDAAHNAIVGRFTSYPGYYFRQHTVAPLKPDFPLTGPFDLSTLYYHHAPGQLGMTLDYLVTEHEVRSGGRIAFPATFEENFVWFRFRTYGHRPGRFHGRDDVWLWMPRTLVSLDNANISWIAGEQGRDTLCLSLSNAATTTETVTVRFGSPLRLPDPGTHMATLHTAAGDCPVKVTDRSLTLEVAGHQSVALTLEHVGPMRVQTRPPIGADLPTEEDDDETSYHITDDTPVGPVRGLLLARPDASGHDAYVQSACGTPATLAYSLDEGATWQARRKAVHPAEWTVRVEATAPSFRFRIIAGADSTDEVRLSAPAC